MVIRDRFALGVVAGLVATIPLWIVNMISVNLGFARWYSYQIGGSIYLHPGHTDTLQGLLFGVMVWLIPAMILGVITSYLIKATGEDFWWLKGIAVTITIMFLIIYGFLYSLGGATIVPFDFATNMSMFVENIVYGITLGYLIKRWGKVAVS
ncbi:MAG: hypothetical protein GX200_04060 [Firmicutes bacterium]|nr:hypothetical protein [Bacillota bacterium]